MFFLLPDAERWRRVLVCGAVLLLLALQGLWPASWLEDAVGRGVAPLSRIVAPLASAVAGAVLPRGAPPGEAPGYVPDLVAMERRAGQPPPVSGVSWLEVPVLEPRLPKGQLLLAAGGRHGLEPGQGIVFGSIWLGRLIEVADEWSLAELWSAPQARTGVRLRDPGYSLRAVAEGHGFGRPPRVSWIEPAAEPQEGMDVLWRPRSQDPPALSADQLSLRLGVLRQVGDASRGQSFWSVDFELPSGAEGRVWVVAAARVDAPVREPLLDRTAALPLLPLDAVLGRELGAVRLLGPGPATLLVQDDVVLGPVRARRRNVLWVHRRAPQSWREEAVALDPDGGRILEATRVYEAGLRSAELYTRGGHGVPRGMRIGRMPDTPPRWRDGHLQAVALPPAGEAGGGGT